MSRASFAIACVLVSAGCSVILGMPEKQLAPAEAPDGGGLATGPNCMGLAPTCGPGADAGCCATAAVPAGTFFSRSYDDVTYQDAGATARPTTFTLDVYEVTVGRFRPFVAAYPGSLPKVQTGRDPHNLQDTGWDASWNAMMPIDQVGLQNDLLCESYTTWTKDPGKSENLPMGCLTWYEAYAFCIWDGGRLPTEAEWNYAASGGNEQRVYPWSSPPTSTSVDGTYAVYAGSGFGVVGSLSPKGDGKWGHSDLAGNVYEWVRDWYSDGYTLAPSPCVDCAAFSGGTAKVMRGGSDAEKTPQGIDTSIRYQDAPTTRFNTSGVRCARDP